MKILELINSSVRGYIIELEKELAMLIDMEVNNGIYIDTYKKLKEFKSKYFNLYEISMEKEVIPSASY
mgnify:CR=1 FL=1